MLAKNKADLTVSLPSDREIVLTRTFAAPPQLVFETWTKPEHIRHWWGCGNATLSVCEVDLRPGGAWRFVLRMPDGRDMPFKGVYREIVRPKLLVYTECYDEPSIGSPEWLTTTIFEEENGQTKLTSTLLHKSIEARNGHLQAGMEDGLADSMGRLEDLLVSLHQEVS
jgi:uncharacterized protein YndB with AHSA1/START domain